MNYKAHISDAERIIDQYNGFVETSAPLFWDDLQISPFLFPAPGKSVHDIQVPDKTVLGKRAEIFFEAMILKAYGFRLIASQIQLINNGVTEGEMDFIVENITSNKLFHVELAYKFFLLDKRVPGQFSQWVGPNRGDTLKRKLDKLLTVQFPKLHHPTAISILDKLGCGITQIDQSLCMPMQLFLPFGESKLSMGKLVSCYAGRWMTFEYFRRENWSGYRFFIPEKQDWFVNPIQCKVWLRHIETLELLNQNFVSGSPLVWVKYRDNIPQKIFVAFW